MSLIAELKRRNVFRVGVAYGIVAWLERAYERRAFLMTQIGSDPRYERLYGDPRFRDLTERIGSRERAPRG